MTLGLAAAWLGLAAACSPGGGGDAAREATPPAGALDSEPAAVANTAETGATTGGEIADAGATAPPSQPTAIAPSDGAVPAAGTAGAAPSDAATLRDALLRFEDTDRVALELLRRECGANARCRDEVGLLASYAEYDCPRDSACPPSITGLLRPLDKAEADGTVALPDSYPLAGDVRAVIDKATHDEALDEQGRAGATADAATPGVTIGTLPAPRDATAGTAPGTPSPAPR